MRLTLYISCFVILLFSSCKKENTEVIDYAPFDILTPSESGISFSNDLLESEAFNIIKYLYYYNGGGVGVGDFNNDGLPDLYFTGNEVSDALYFNQGNLSFEEVSSKAGIMDEGWSTGVSVVDINQDGWLDIYVCKLGNYRIYKDHNKLFINQKDGTFNEQSKEYGLDFSGFSTQAAFFDYDRDGDYDCYLLNHSVKNPSQFANANKTRYNIDTLAGDKLMENRNGKFVDVSQEAGIYQSSVGFGLGIGIGDLNEDGWADIYIGNDFHENDYLYINNGDGTFSEKIKESTGHTSNFTMGVTIEDLNNDGMLDIVSLDMQPGDEKTYKNSGGWESYEIYKFKRSYNYHHQSPKNGVQINLGNNLNIPIFSEQSGTLGLMATDWSWSPLIGDFNQDGKKDIYITNGIVRRPNDLDFVNYLSVAARSENTDDTHLVQEMPNGEVPNQLFFQGQAGFDKKEILNAGAGISTGGVTVDLDADGDLDIVINNINRPASILRNNLNNPRFVNISFPVDRYPIGGKITAFQNEKSITKNIQQATGFLSSIQSNVLIGFPDSSAIDSIVINDEKGGMWKHYNVNINSIINAYDGLYNVKNYRNTFEGNIDTLDFEHVENKYNDQNANFLMPYLLSTYGPKIAKGKEQLYITGARGMNGAFINQLGNTKELKKDPSLTRAIDENNATFIDIDNDGDEDLYICTGGHIFPENQPLLKDVFMRNENGSYVMDQRIIPEIYRNTSVAVASDYDQDGDQDLFIGVQSKTNEYGLSMPSYILENVNGALEKRPLELDEMVFDAQWSDIDNDGDEDLIIVGHWMPITIFKNNQGKLIKEVIPSSEGWWFSLLVEDIDNDGNQDILAGNFGENHRFNVGSEDEMKLYLKDFDENGKKDPIMTYQEAGKEYIYPNLELFLKQLPGKKKEYVHNKDFSGKTVQEIFSEKELEGSIVKKCATLSSSFFKQSSKGKWSRFDLPDELQVSSIHAIKKIKNNSIAFAGNFYEVDPNLGRQDALPLSVYNYKDGWIKTSRKKEGNIMSPIRDIEVIGDRLVLGVNSGKSLMMPIRVMK